MRQLGIPPKWSTFDRQQSNDWMEIVGERLKVYSGTADPTTAEVPENQWIVYRNTTSGEIRLWTNDAGVMKKSAALT